MDCCGETLMDSCHRLIVQSGQLQHQLHGEPMAGGVVEVFLARWELFGEKTPLGKDSFLASSSGMVGRTSMLSPFFHSPGVTSFFSAVSWKEIILLRISSMFLPVVAG